MPYSLSKLDYLALALHIIAFFTIVVGAHVSGFENLLKTMTKENGFFESMSLLLLLGMAIFLIQFALKHRKELSLWLLLIITLFGLLSFVAAMEEISWGQQIFHFESGALFKEANLQKETNLHNFINPELFSSIIYISVYAFFVFIPLIIRLLASRIVLFSKLSPWLPSLHVSLIILFASSFQAYFYDEFGAWFDMGTQMVGMAFFALYIYINYAQVDWILKLHYLAVVLTIGIFMLSYKVFGFFNMQYEIREMFVVLASLYYVVMLSEEVSCK